MAYTQVTVAAYNSSPPPDDGTHVAANQVTWAGIKTKLADPIKTAFDTCQANITDVVSNEIEVNLWAPATTAMTFNQTAAPLHWTKSVTNNDAMLRVVSGVVSSGGTTAISALSATNIGAHTLTSLEVPSHTHTFSGTTGTVSADHTHFYSGTTSGESNSHTHNYTESQFNNVNRGTGSSNTNQGSQSNNTGSNSNGHTHTFSGTTGGISVNHTHAYSGTTSSSGSDGSHTHAWGISPKYVDLIIATKD